MSNQLTPQEAADALEAWYSRWGGSGRPEDERVAEKLRAQAEGIPTLTAEEFAEAADLLFRFSFQPRPDRLDLIAKLRAAGGQKL